MRMTISELAKVTDLTVRTLRFYDEIGLVAPAGTTTSGMREYGSDEVLRLQRVLVYRQLDVPLEQIGQILAGELDPQTALLQQREMLLLEQQRLAELVGSVDYALRSFAIKEEEIRTAKDARNLFDGFDTTAIEADAQRHWAEQADASRTAIDGMSVEDARMAQDAHEARLRQMGALVDEGAAADDPRTQAVVAEMHHAMTAMWTPDAAAFTQVGEQLASQPESVSVLSKVTPALPVFLCDAYAHYAATRLS
ncbi:HTH-type transcriptional activator TipA (plasmid) [Clavibacter michiganensis]|uniref:MerR family transcriptional regulator n=1 Tax=Clavibacter michiganensis TaxID=28447 RepID=UPI000A37BDA0|nr:MerR family transcriptional regulator [Clavibacter michiganensis]MWJ14268.1 MerR family transcriptional regulator [Clavibacter michiganensis subsp. michiganensis]OUE28660.1 HTH-type transcriptional activator TipA [Clavibacter michiganensis]